MRISYIYTLRHKIYIIYHRPPALSAADSLSTGTIVQPLQKARCTSQRNIIRVAWESFLSFASFSHFISHQSYDGNQSELVFFMKCRMKHRNFAIICLDHVVICFHERYSNCCHLVQEHFQSHYLSLHRSTSTSPF